MADNLATVRAPEEPVAEARNRDDEALRRRLMKRWLEVEAIYHQSWYATHKDIIDFIQPKRGEFQVRVSNRGDRKDGEIINNAAGDACQKLAAAMDTGITSEAREWFTLAPEDPALEEDDGVREYCHTVQSILFGLIAKSTFYKANRNLQEDLVGPAVGLMHILEDEEDVFRCTHVPVGSYRVWLDSKGDVCGMAERFVYTASQMAEEFGVEKCSHAVRQALKNGTIQVQFQVLHLVEKRYDFLNEPAQPVEAKRKPWASNWLELGVGMWGANVALGNGEINAPLGPTGMLRESGYDEQPFICVRWNAIGMNAYGTESPGWKTLGDVKALQGLELVNAKNIARIGDPPMSAPAGMENASNLPGAVNYLGRDAKGAKYEPSIIIPPQAITAVAEEKREYERRINRTCYGDVLFLLSNDERNQPRTAEEIRGKKEERLLQLGGVFARYGDEGLKKAIRRMFSIAQRARMLPPPPPALTEQGQGRLKIAFQNPLVTAQKTVGYGAMQQLLSLGIAVAQARAAGVDKIDGDEVMDSGADMLGVKPNLLFSDEELAKRRQAEAQAKQAQATGQAMTQAAPAIKDLSSADPEKLRALLQQFGSAAVAEGAGGGA